MNVVNFAHGALFMVGAYVGVLLYGYTGSFWLSLVAAPLAMGLLGLAAEPCLLFLDEPSEGIMPILVEGMSEQFVAMKRAGTTILLVEQNVDLALDVCDRVYIAKADVGGKIATLGGRLMQATSRKLADAFFGTFAAELGTAGDPGVPAPAAA